LKFEPRSLSDSYGKEDQLTKEMARKEEKVIGGCVLEAG
jgi:hypothetical protein